MRVLEGEGGIVFKGRACYRYNNVRVVVHVMSGSSEPFPVGHLKIVVRRCQTTLHKSRHSLRAITNPRLAFNSSSVTKRPNISAYCWLSCSPMKLLG